MEMINSKHLPPTLTFEEVERILQLQTSDVWSLQIVFIFCLPHRFGSLFSSAASYKTWFQDFDNVKIGFLSGGIADDIWSERDTDKNQKDSGLILIWCIANDWRWLSIKEFSMERVLFAKLVLQSQVIGLCSSWRSLITTTIRRRCQIFCKRNIKIDKDERKRMEKDGKVSCWKTFLVTYRELEASLRSADNTILKI